MKPFFRSVLVASASIGTLVCILVAYLLIVHASPDQRAFFNSIAHRGISDTLSDEQPFEIWKLGSRVEVPFNVRYTREVAVVLDFKNRFPSGGTVYSGRLLLQYYQGNRLVHSKTYSKVDSHIPHFGSTQASIVLDTQVLPLHGGPMAHSVVVEVLEADPRFAEFQNVMKIQVRGTFNW